MDAILLALLAGVFAGGANVATRLGLRRAPDVEAAALTMTAVAFVVAAVAAAATATEAAAWDELWPYLVVGVFVPGLISVVFIWAVREAGPSRTAVLINTFPLFAAALAIVFLGEPLRAGLAAGDRPGCGRGRPDRPRSRRSLGVPRNGLSTRPGGQRLQCDHHRWP